MRLSALCPLLQAHSMSAYSGPYWVGISTVDSRDKHCINNKATRNSVSDRNLGSWPNGRSQIWKRLSGWPSRELKIIKKWIKPGEVDILQCFARSALLKKIFNEMMIEKLKLDKKFKPCLAEEGDELFPNGIFEFNITKMLKFIHENKDQIVFKNLEVKSYRRGLSCLNEDTILTAQV